MTRIPTLSDVRQSDGSSLTAAAGRWTSTAAAWEDQFTKVWQRMCDPERRWDGEAAEAAQRRAGLDRLGVIGLADHLHEAARIASAGAQRIEQARRAVLDTVSAAERAGFTVADDFTLTPDDALMVGRTLAAKVETFASVRQHVAAELTAASAALGSFSFSVPAPGQDPQSFAGYWSSLTPDQRDEAFDTDHTIGNQAGMPFVDRDIYNRRHLDELQHTTQTEFDAMRDRFDGLAAMVYRGDRSTDTADELRDMVPRLTATRHRLDGYLAVRESLSSAAEVPRYLALVDDAGHAAISIGNPDTASRTALFVPGTGQDLAAVRGSVSRATDTHRAALAADTKLSRRDVSVTAWLAYDRPMALSEAGSPIRARNGGPALDRFLNGMHASHLGPPALDTVIGHSYGSTVVGAAAVGGNHLDADNVIAVGSPGMLSDHAADLALEPGARVYSMTARNDPIRLVTDLTLGADPNAAGYGGIRLTTDPGAALRYSAGLLPGVDAHDSYWDVGNPGLRNMGAVVAGLPPQQAGR